MVASLTAAQRAGGVWADAWSHARQRKGVRVVSHLLALVATAQLAAVGILAERALLRDGRYPLVAAVREVDLVRAVTPGPPQGPPSAVSPPAPVVPPSLEPVLACIRRIESGGSGGYRAVSRSGRYRGAYQFDRHFWLTYGGDPAYAGLPGDRATWRWELAPPAVQDAVALRGYAARGLSPWPSPRRACR